MRRIMVVDDDPDILRYCDSILTARGNEVVTCHSAESALQVLLAHPFDLLVLDVVMPKMSGFDLMREARSIPHLRAPIMMLTGKSSPNDVAQALALGATDYMVKPFDRDVFLAKFEALTADDDEQGTVRFAETSPYAAAELSLPAIVASVTEMGMRLLTPNYVDRGQHVEVNTAIFEQIGINRPPLRAAWCRPLDKNNEYRYEVYVSFIGLDEPSMRRIRQWITARSVGRVRVAQT